jgi:hypothetical protein
MQLALDVREKELLQRIVEEYYSNLREEIYKTEGAAFKDQLKEEEGMVQGLLARIRALG